MWRLFGLMAALLASGVGVGAEGESAPAVPVVTAEVTEQPRDRSTEFVARVRAIEAVDVRGVQLAEEGRGLGFRIFTVFYSVFMCFRNF